MGRFQQAEDVAKLVLFLASEDASEITGEDVNITGGLMMQRFHHPRLANHVGAPDQRLLLARRAGNGLQLQPLLTSAAAGKPVEVTPG